MTAEDRAAGLARIDRVLERVVRGGEVIARSDGSAHHVFPVAVDSPAVLGDPGYDAASWVLSESDGSADPVCARVTQVAAALDYPEQRIWAWAWPLVVDNLLTKLHEPGWPPERISQAFALTRSIASIAAPSWRDALN